MPPQLFAAKRLLFLRHNERHRPELFNFFKYNWKEKLRWTVHWVFLEIRSNKLVGLSVCLKSTYFVLGGFEERYELISCEIFGRPQDSRIHTVCTWNVFKAAPLNKSTCTAPVLLIGLFSYISIRISASRGTVPVQNIQYFGLWKTLLLHKMYKAFLAIRNCPVQLSLSL